MKLAASQIGWEQTQQPQALEILRSLGFAGLEIAPTMVGGQQPYAHPQQAEGFAAWLREEYGLAVCSMQSIWYGQTGNMFGPQRQHFIQYTKAAIRFAQACGAGNLVFGNPKNRSLPQGGGPQLALPFFKQLGDYAARHGTVLALEANPPLYGTNFMNTTPDALAMAKAVGSPGCRVNLDFGTLLINEETVESLRGHVGEINHVHISEAQLAPVQQRPQHGQLAALLKEEGYKGYVSIEMKAQPLDTLRSVAQYVAEVFG